MTQESNNTVHLTKEKGTLQLLPGPWSLQNAKCMTWIITVPEGKLVNLRVTYFWNWGRRCKNTTLQIRDGQNSSSDPFGSLCGLGKNQETLFSSGRHLWVRLQFSKNEPADFYAVFEAADPCKAKRTLQRT